VLITIGEAVAYVVSGMYGDVRDLGTVNAVLIILQARTRRRGLRRVRRAAGPRRPMRLRAAATAAADIACVARSCSWPASS